MNKFLDYIGAILFIGTVIVLINFFMTGDPEVVPPVAKDHVIMGDEEANEKHCSFGECENCGRQNVSLTDGLCARCIWPDNIKPYKKPPGKRNKKH